MTNPKPASYSAADVIQPEMARVLAAKLKQNDCRLPGECGDRLAE